LVILATARQLRAPFIAFREAIAHPEPAVISAWLLQMIERPHLVVGFAGAPTQYSS
jgi:hypothetical protein